MKPSAKWCVLVLVLGAVAIPTSTRITRGQDLERLADLNEKLSGRELGKRKFWRIPQLSFLTSRVYRANGPGKIPNNDAVELAERIRGRYAWLSALPRPEMESSIRGDDVRNRMTSDHGSYCFNRFETVAVLVPAKTQGKWLFETFYAYSGFVGGWDPEWCLAEVAKYDRQSGVTLDDIENLDDLEWAIGIRGIRKLRTPKLD